MATESLLIELDARTSKLDAKLKATQKKLDGMDKKVKKTERSFSDFMSTAAAATATLITSMGILARQTAAYVKELEIAATRSNETIQNFQAQAFAAQSVGISLEKLGDIGKDTQEKIGDFLATGAGGFMDFVDVMGMTNEEATEFAKTLNGLSSTEILQALVNRMEAAGISGQKMSFALEGIASDATDLIPLLTKSGEKMGVLTDEFEQLGVGLTEVDVEKIKDVSFQFGILGEKLKDAGSKITANFSSEIIAATKLLGLLVTKAKDLFVFLGEGFTGVGEALGASLYDFLNDADTLPKTLENINTRTKQAFIDLFGEDSSIVDLLIGDPDEVRKNFDKLNVLVSDGLKKITKTTEKVAKTESEAEKKRYLDKVSSTRKGLQAVSVLNESFMNDNKAINAGLIIADTAAAIMGSLKRNPYDYGNVALLAATGLAQLAANNSASKGGGSVSSASGGGSANLNDNQQSFNDDQASLLLTEQDEGGAQTLRVVFDTADGQNLLDVLAEGINENMRNGR
jgi:hypothetical protein